MNPGPPIETLALFPRLDALLIELLASLSDSDWERQTLAPQWKVRDVAAHLLDGNIRTLSMLRDGYFGEQAGNIQSYEELVGFLNRLNADWVRAMRRVSPAVLIELLALTGAAYTAYLESLDPFAQAAFAVAWAGEAVSANWFHIAREYTEKWHHQQQIRFAVGQEQALYSPSLYFPYLDTSMRALPHHYRSVTAPAGECVQFHITGEGGGTWTLCRMAENWVLENGAISQPACEVLIEGAIAWRILTKGISREEARNRVKISGKRELGEPVFDLLAVMA